MTDFTSDLSGMRVKARRAPQSEKSKRRPGKHVPNGFPHLSSITGACLCTDRCCQGDSGCHCKTGCSGMGHDGCDGAWDLGTDQD